MAGSNILDISSAQGDIDLMSLTPSFDGVIVKATQGNGYTNPYFHGQAGTLQNKDKLAGSYHYLDGSGWKAEADHFVTTMKNYQGHHIWVADWENNPGAGENPAFVRGDTGYLKNFMDEVTRQLGYKGIVYASISPVRTQDFTEIAAAGYKLWYAQYANTDPTGWQSSPWNDGQGFGAFKADQVVGQQYTDNLRLGGYTGPLDGSLFNLDGTAWKDHATGSTPGQTMNNVTPASSTKVKNDPCMGLGLAGLASVISHTYAPRKGLR